MVGPHPYDIRPYELPIWCEIQGRDRPVDYRAP